MTWYPLSPYGGYPDSAYTKITSTDPNNPTVAGNTGAYIEFTGLTGADQTFDLVGSGNNGSGGIAGFQIIDTAEAVPEPKTWVLFAIGAIGLAGWRRQRWTK